MTRKRKGSEVAKLKHALRQVQTTLSQAQNQLDEANFTLHAIQSGAVDAVVTIDPGTGATKVLNLKSAEHPHRIFVEALSEGALTVNQDGVSIFCNRHFSEMMETNPGNILGKALFDFFPKEEKATVLQILEQGMHERIQQEITLQTWGGKLLQVQLSVAPVKSEDLQGICILVTDLSERHRTAAALRRAMERAQMVEQLQAALRLRDEFLMVASHELKTPMTSLMMQLQIARRLLNTEQVTTNTIEHERFSMSVDTCIRQGKRLITLVEDLLDVAQLEAGQLKLYPEQVNLSTLVKGVVHQFQNDARTLDCNLELEPHVEGFWDPVRLEQVLVNLLSNAFKYGEGRNVEIKVRRSNSNHALLAIRDFGMGIPQEMQSKIFDRFTRGVRAEEISGFGLGLYIAKQIIESHGGSIRVESKQFQGTTFFIELPLQTMKFMSVSNAA